METGGLRNQDRSILDCLPLEVITAHILTRVAACSSDDLFYVKQSCKTLYDVSEAPCILRSVSLNKFDQFAATLKGQTFLERCTIAENPEALYRTGMIQHFKMDAMYGMDCLQRAMNCGHLNATYAVGIILLLQEGEPRHNGMQIITDLKKIYKTTTKFDEIRQKFLRHLSWINHTFIVGREMPRCCTKHPVTNSGWQNFEDVDLDCHDCSCHQEIVHLWKYLPIYI